MTAPIPGTAHVTVAGPNLIYIVLADRETFDAIAVPEIVYDRVSVKVGKWNDVELVFQLWHSPIRPLSPSQA